MKMKGCAAPDIMNESGDGNKRVAMETSEFPFSFFDYSYLLNGLTDFSILAMSSFVFSSSAFWSCRF